MVRAIKRRRVDAAAPNGDVSDGILLAPQLRLLVESVLLALDLDVSLASPELLRIRRADAVGVGVLSLDVAVRLFHAHGVRGVLHNAEPSTDADQSVDVPEQVEFGSAAALAAFCVRVIEHTLRTNPTPFASISRVSLPGDRAQAGGIHADRILVHTREFARETKQATPLEDRISVLFRDDAVVVVHKPHNMLSVDGNERDQPSVQSLLRAYYPESRMVHRLDQETSGILVVALTRTAAQHLNQQFRDRSVDKMYVARVLGHVADDGGVIALRMAPSKTDKLVQRVVDGIDGAPTRTEWHVLQRSGEGGCDPHHPSTLVRLKPVTGKTHQLRVHMQHRGHPILGDSLYSPERVHTLAPRLLLHATAITFQHPVTNDRVLIQCKHEFA